MDHPGRHSAWIVLCCGQGSDLSARSKTGRLRRISRMLRWARRRRAQSSPPAPHLVAAFAAFDRSLALIEEAKRRLASAAPRGRSPGIPLAEALASFESLIRGARDALPGWRVEDADAEWRACEAGAEESLRRAERLRLEGSPEGYEELYGVLADIIEPLDAFAAALGRLRRLGPDGEGAAAGPP